MERVRRGTAESLVFGMDAFCGCAKNAPKNKKGKNMKIYLLEKDVDNFRSCFIKETSLDKKELRAFNKGERLSIDDNSISFYFDTERDYPIGNVFHCWDMKGFLVDEAFYDVFSKMPDTNAQFIKFQEGFFLLNNLAIVDALDANKTEFEVLQDIIVGVKKYMFLNQQYPFMFQIKLPTGFVLRNYYVTDEFINFVNDNNLKGFLFKEVWDSGN